MTNDQQHVRFWKRLAVMLTSGVPLMGILRCSQEELTATPLGEALRTIIEGMECGEHLSDGLGRFPGLFGSDLVALVQAGEEQGRLDVVATTIGEQVEKGVLSTEHPSRPDGSARPGTAQTVAGLATMRDGWNEERLRYACELVHEAVAAGASDVHLEPIPGARGVVGFRVDGELGPSRELAGGDYRRLVAQVKLMSCLDLGEEKLPQDGRVRMRSDGKKVEFRVSSGPTVFGEAVCIRFLDDVSDEQQVQSLELVIPDTELRERLVQLVRQPQGLLLIAGPGCSGEQTTSRALLARVDSLHRRVLSVEDSAERTLPNVHHVHVRPDIGLTFAATLRHFLRMDPDVVHCSDVPDGETASVLLRVALTGHLTLGVLHAGDAISGLEMLLELGMGPYLLTEALLAVTGQRLVRRLCPVCRRPSSEATKRLRELTGDAIPAEATLYEPVGCGKCLGHGYRGLRTVLEVLSMSHGLKCALHRGASRPELEGAARAEGFTTMFENAVPAMLSGETSLIEILRVCPHSVLPHAAK